MIALTLRSMTARLLRSRLLAAFGLPRWFFVARSGASRGDAARDRLFRDRREYVPVGSVRAIPTLGLTRRFFVAGSRASKGDAARDGLFQERREYIPVGSGRAIPGAHGPGRGHRTPRPDTLPAALGSKIAASSEQSNGDVIASTRIITAPPRARVLRHLSRRRRKSSRERVTSRTSTPRKRFRAERCAHAPSRTVRARDGAPGAYRDVFTAVLEGACARRAAPPPRSITRHTPTAPNRDFEGAP